MLPVDIWKGFSVRNALERSVVESMVTNSNTVAM